MEKLQKSLLVTSEFDLIYFLISITLCIFCSLILKFLFEKKSTSNSVQISKIIPLLAVITFLVISVVKTSLALSLGLVGALSIIRFRTPIKNPEDLIYLFLSLAIGIGFGANQVLITLLSFVVIVFLIFFVIGKKKNIKDSFYNLIIRLDQKNFDEIKDFQKIIDLIKEEFSDSSMTKYEKSYDKKYAFYFAVNAQDINQIHRVNLGLKNITSDFDFYFFETSDKTI